MLVLICFGLHELEIRYFFLSAGLYYTPVFIFALLSFQRRQGKAAHFYCIQM